MDCLWSCLTYSQRPSLKINSQRYSIVRLLGDGGYAYVYLVSEAGTDRLLALKKIRCMFGGESVANAMREVEAGHVFKYSDRVTGCIDSAVVQEEDGTKTVYILMPYYSRGSLQDKINDNIVNNTDFSQAEVVAYALGISQALEVLHMHRHRDSSDGGSEASSEIERERLLNGSDVDGVLLGDLEPYAHRDIKPANIMFTDGSTESHAIIIDLGFCSPAKVNVMSRTEAVQLQDLAAEHCTLPFRAPELFDVRTGSSIDEKVDIWAFGCTLYNLMYSASPFEREEQVSGANINIAIARGKFSFPEEPAYSAELKQIVSKCLQTKPTDRPSISQIIDLLEAM